MDSVSVVVEVDSVLDEEGNWGAEKVLDTVETRDSCEAGRSDGLYSGATVAGCMLTKMVRESCTLDYLPTYVCYWDSWGRRDHLRIVAG